jgi:hypothetical protein
VNPVLLDLSRHHFCELQADEDGKLFLDARKPFRFQVFSDTVVHIVGQGETLFNLAGFYYSQRERPAGLWWVIADFQPTPIHDPTIRLTPGQILYIPSLRVIFGEIFSESRRTESRL